jgi:hypothetical protein
MVSRATRSVLGLESIRRYVLYREWIYQTLEHPRTWKALTYHSLLYVPFIGNGFTRPWNIPRFMGA